MKEESPAVMWQTQCRPNAHYLTLPHFYIPLKFI